MANAVWTPRVDSTQMWRRRLRCRRLRRVKGPEKPTGPVQRPSPPTRVGGTESADAVRIIAEDAEMMSSFTRTMTTEELKRRLGIMRSAVEG